MANKKAIFGSKVSFQERHFTAQEEERFSNLEQKVHIIDMNLRRFSPTPIRRDSPYPSPQRYPNDNNWSYRSPTRDNDGNRGRPRTRDYNRGFQGRRDGNYRYSPSGNRNVQPRYQSPSQPRYQSPSQPRYQSPSCSYSPSNEQYPRCPPQYQQPYPYRGDNRAPGDYQGRNTYNGGYQNVPQYQQPYQQRGIIGQHGIIRIEMLQIMGIIKTKNTLRMHIYQKTVARKGKAVMIEKTLIRHKPDKPREAQV